LRTQGVDCVRKAADEFSANFSRGGVDEWTKREGMMVGNIPMNKDADGKGVVSFVVGDWFKMTEKVLSLKPSNLHILGGNCLEILST
jgi:hypothetical protein